jgi:glycosyltransferase involved in cell wall biosynthesis
LVNDRTFTALAILNIASSFERKNPCAAIKAFRQAFGNDPTCRLIVKHSNAFTYPEALQLMTEAAGGASNIVFLSDVMDAAGIDRLYAEADVVMSLHRAEGFGLVVAEAMLRGLPVVATGWSGNTDFLTRETGMPVGYNLIPARDPQDTYEHPEMCWADPNVAEAAAALRMLRADAELRAQLGQRALLHATELFSSKLYGENAKTLLSID